jgi:hypothetical protein
MELRTIVFNSMLAIIVVLPFVTLWLASPIVWTALRTGRLLGRGQIFDRIEPPAMFYGGIIFWFVLLAVLILISSLVLTHWLSRWNLQ